MSDLYRSAISARLSKLPADLPMPEGDEDDEGADSLGVLPGSGMGPPPMQVLRPARSKRKKKDPNPAFSPISAASYFAEAVQVSVPSRNLDCRVYYTPPSTSSAPTVMACVHGAGYCGLSFACFAKEVTDLSRGECGVLAVDMRRHGKTVSSASDEDLSIDVLVQDFSALIQTIFPDPTAAPSLLLIGHSMGASVAVRACPLLLEKKYRIAGVTVIDVVEGSAIEALPHMMNLLNARPDGFDSVEEAVEWHVTTKTIRNPISARVSVPAIVKPSESTLSHVPAYVWHTTLRSTAPYWQGWFSGLSSKFLAARTARLLVLAGTDRLDKELMIGQMQGKFQMEVIPGVGHMVQEDNPTRLAEIMVEFWRRNERMIVGIKKVGDS